VTIVEYGDFECRRAPGLSRRENPAQALRGPRALVFRHFPLLEVHPHASSRRGREAAGAQHKFWPMHDLLSRTSCHLKANNLRQYAQRAELDLERYDYEMKEHLYLQRVHEHIDSGVKSGVRSTPGFFVNGVVEDVSFGLERLHQAVETASEVNTPGRPGPKSSERMPQNPVWRD